MLSRRKMESRTEDAESACEGDGGCGAGCLGNGAKSPRLKEPPAIIEFIDNTVVRLRGEAARCNKALCMGPADPWRV